MRCLQHWKKVLQADMIMLQEILQAYEMDILFSFDFCYLVMQEYEVCAYRK
jgi:hypothetical protein